MTKRKIHLSFLATSLILILSSVSVGSLGALWAEGPGDEGHSSSYSASSSADYEGPQATEGDLETNTYPSFLKLGTLNDEEAKKLGEDLKIHKNILRLTLGVTGNDGVKEIAKGLKTNNNIFSLSLLGPIDEEGEQAIVDALESNTKLTSLRLNDRPFESQINPLNLEETSTQKEIRKLLQKNIDLKIADDLKKNIEKIDSTGGSRGIGYGTSFFADSVSDESIKMIFQAAKNYPDIKYITLVQSDISDKGVKIITDAIRANKNIEMIHLNGSRISYQAELMILDALKHNTTLRGIDWYWYSGSSRHESDLPKTEARIEIDKISERNTNLWHSQREIEMWQTQRRNY